MFDNLKLLLTILAIMAGIFVVVTKNAIISVFYLIVLYILVAFYLIYIGVTYLGISYIIVYIGAIAILFLFIIMMIDIEVVEKRSNNYLPLLFFLLGGFLISMKNILYNLGVIKIKSIFYQGEYEDILFIENKKDLFTLKNINFELSLYSKFKNESMKRDYDKDTSLDLLDINNICVESMGIEEFTGILTQENFISYLFNRDEKEQEFESIKRINNKIENLKMYDTDYSNLSNYKLKNNFIENIYIKTDHLTFVEEKSNYWLNKIVLSPKDNGYLILSPDWSSALSKMTQISAIGNLLYTVYHSYLYIVSVILLLAMVGAIILTAENTQQIRIVKVERVKKNGFEFPIYVFYKYFSILVQVIRYRLSIVFQSMNLTKNKGIYFKYKISLFGIYPFSNILDNENVEKYYEGITGNLIYFIIANLIIGLLLLGINSYFSLSIKYLEKGGGFECGFTSFVQTRERFNIIFYRVSLLFLIFDLEIILIFPFPAIYDKSQALSKNNVLAFLYILVVGFIFELKEGALNIVKKAHSSKVII
jgi:NADH-ubiquinone oxidoreductase chain 6